MPELSIGRQKDREKMAAILESIVREAGAAVTRAETCRFAPREIRLDVKAARGLHVSISLDPDSGNHKGGGSCYVLPWHMSVDSDATLSAEFGRVANGPVNQFHRRKCTAVNYGFDALRDNLRNALTFAADGRAFNS